MSLRVDIKKKDLWLLSAIIVFMVGVGFVMAWTYPGETAVPSIHGHTSDEINGGLGFGWINNYTQIVNSVTPPSLWTDLDLSFVVGNKSVLTMLRVCVSSGAGWSSSVAFRKKGDSIDFGHRRFTYNVDSGEVYGAGVSAATIGDNRCADIFVETDSFGKTQWVFEGKRPVTNVSLIGYFR